MNVLTAEELTERFYHVKAQRDKLLWGLSAVLDMAGDELRRLGAVPGSNVAQIEADARALLDEIRGDLSGDKARGRAERLADNLYAVAERLAEPKE